MRLDAALDETARRATAMDTSGWAAIAQRIVDDCHPEQRDFVLDPSRYIAALVGRGGGKTAGGRARFLRRLLTTPGANCFYIAKTRDHAERLMWRPLKEIFKKIGFIEDVDVIYNETKLRIILPKTGARLQLFGADKPGYLDQFRGESYHEIGIDEAAFHADRILIAILDSIIGPRLLGSLWLIGTPGDIPKGRFYELTRRGAKLSRLYSERAEHPGFRGCSLHKWTLASAIEKTRDRPIAELLEIYEAQQQEILDKQWSPENPVRRKELDGEWAASGSANVYTYRIHDENGALWNQWDPPRDGPMQIARLPLGPGGVPFTYWCHILAMDPGWSDPTALNLFSFAIDDPTMKIYHRLCIEKTGLYSQKIAHIILGIELNKEKPGGIIGAIGQWPSGMISDTAHQMAEATLAELSGVYGIHFEPAKKGFHYKVGAIMAANGHLIDGRMQVLKGSELEAQLLDLQWDETKSGEQIERKGQPNHSADTMIYGLVMYSTMVTATALADAPDPRKDPRHPEYEPPMPASVQDDYAAIFGDDYAALLGA